LALQVLEIKEMGESVSLKIFYAVCVIFATSILGVTDTVAQTERYNDEEVISQGKELFSTNCAVCHGENAEGTVKNWQELDENGKYPAPPLNGTAHAWHHSINGLANVIRSGTISMGGSMPAWQGKLSDDEIFSLIMYLSTLWPEELYQSWMEINQQ
jgi:mono/diheme cytochrome c family protein